MNYLKFVKLLFFFFNYYAIIIADILPNNEIKWHTDLLLEALKKANGKFIRFVVLVGGYQKGKTSFIALTTGNDKHEFGNGENAKTIGALLDGPYTIPELAHRWRINKYEDIDDDESIFFIDIEGFGSFNRGNSENQMKAFYSKLCAPFIAISSNIIFLLEKNESSYSVMHIISALKFGNFAIKCFDGKNSFNTSFELMAIVLKIKSINRINYSRPDLSKYKKISQYLKNHWQREKFNESNANIVSKPLPSYREGKNIFKFVISDFLDDLIKSNSRIKTNSPENICNFFTQITNINIFDDELLKKTSHDFFTQTICDIVHNVYNNNMPQKFDQVFHNYLSSQKKFRLCNDIILVENDLLNILEKCLLIEFDIILHQKIRVECFQINEVESEIGELKKKISEKVKNRLPDLISDIKAMIISKAKHIKLSIMKEVELEYKNIRQRLYNIKVLQYTPTIQKELFNIFNSELLPMANNMMNKKIKSYYFIQVIELYDIKNSMCDEINQKINSGLPNIQIKMKKKKKIQTAAKVGIGAAAGLAGVALIGTGIGAAVGAAVAAGTAGTAAVASASAAGATAVASAGAAAASSTAVATSAGAIITATATTATAATGATIASTAGVGAAIGAGVGGGVGAVAGGVTGGLIKKPDSENTS